MNRLNRRMRRALLAMGLAAFMAGSARAQTVRQYIVIAPAVHMPQYTRNSQSLYCSNAGDFVISAGRWLERDGMVIKFPHGGDDPGSEVPILDKDMDGAIGFQINTQNDGAPANLFAYIQCLTLPGQVQQRQ